MIFIHAEKLAPGNLVKDEAGKSQLVSLVEVRGVTVHVSLANGKQEVLLRDDFVQVE